MEKLLTLRQVSEMFGCNDPKGRMVRNLRAKGILPGIKIGTRLLFKESDVQEYIDNLYEEQNKKCAH